MLLRNKDRKALLDIFSSVDDAFEVWSYGSRVDGSAHEGSDLDLVVRWKPGKKMNSETFSLLKDKIKHSNIPILVDLFDWTSLSQSFQENILEQYEVLYKKEERSTEKSASNNIEHATAKE